MKSQTNSELAKSTVNDSDYSVEVASKNHREWLYLFSKRFIDIVASLVGILIIFFLIIVFSAIYLIGENKGPMFFKQERIGQNGRKIHIV